MKYKKTYRFKGVEKEYRTSKKDIRKNLRRRLESIIDRCLNVNRHNYKDYGGIGTKGLSLKLYFQIVGLLEFT